MNRFSVLAACGLMIQVTLAAQALQQSTPAGQPAQQAAPAQQGAQAIPGAAERFRPNYVLRPGDQILIRAFEMEEINERPFLIDGEGMVSLPQLGRIKAGGLTVESFEADLVERLRKFVVRPQATVTVTQFSKEPIFFVGAFKAPGIYTLDGRRTLVETMSSIGGLQPTASRRIKITRRKEFGELPLPNSVLSSDGSTSSVEINMASLQNNVNPAEDIVLQPFDVISVERSEMVYVNGEVGRVGALELQERDSISVIQALTLAGGLAPSANRKAAWILRPVQNTSRRAEIPLNLERIMSGKESDRPLLPNDVLYVPKSSSVSRAIGRSTLPLVGSLVGILIAVTR